MDSRKILAVILALIPVAYSYAFPFFINNLGHAMFLFLALPILLFDCVADHFRGASRGYCKYYLLFSVYLALITIVAPWTMSYGPDGLGVLSTCEFAVTIFFLISDTRLSKQFIEVYSRIAVIFSIFLLIQYVAYVFGGVTISGKIPFLKEYEREIGTIGEGRLLRISSVFAEPSHFSVYVIPALIMFLFGKTSQKGTVIKIGIITLAVLLSTSSNGLVSMMIAYVAFIYHKYFSKIQLGHIIIGCAIIYVAYYFLSNSEYISSITYGLFEQQEGMTAAKAENRIYRGFLLYADLPLDRQLFGVGWRSAEEYCKVCNNYLLTKYAYDGFNYFNSLAGSLIFSGLIGFLFLVSFFVSLFRSTGDFATRALIIIVFILMGTSSVLLTDQWIFFLSAIISMINIGKHEESNNYTIPQSNGYFQ